MHQPKKLQLKHRASTIKRALIDAGTQGMQVGELLASVDEPGLTRDTLAVWVADHQGRIQAVRGGRTSPGGYVWHHRAAFSKAPAPTVRSTPAQRAPRGRVITITLPALPRLTRLRAYSLAVTLYAAALTLVEVL
jgi:hypothetical protein